MRFGKHSGKRANALAVVAAVVIGLGATGAGAAAAAPAASMVMVMQDATPFEPGVHRLAGGDRFATAVAISQRFAPGVPVLYLATGADFPDALSAASAAAHQGGPLLLTQAEAIPEVVRAELVRLAPQRIVIAGGEAAVGAPVVNDLATLVPGIPIERIGGGDRYETGRLLIDDAFATVNEVFIATGRDFPDALAATAAAHRRGAPVLLVDGRLSSIGAVALDRIRLLQASTVRIAGGAGAVSAGIEQELRSRGLTVFRHEGTDRYLTAAAINTAVFAGTAPSTAFLATGAGFADALAGAALAGALVSPMFLTRADCIPYGVSTAITQLAPTSRVLLGGPSVVGDSVAAGTACAAEWVKPASGRITDGYGPRAPICTPSGCTQSFHRGVDLATGCSAPISAATSGRISTAGWVGTFGNFIRIAHGSGIDTGYAHLVNGGILVGVGQTVRAGQQVGWSGATGAATGCHLHFEVYVDGTQVDPVPFMSVRGVTFG